MHARRFATLDVGTNTVLLLVAETDGRGGFRPVLERGEITRLGRGVDRTGRLSDEALADTLGAIGRFADEARALGCEAIAATATSAARDAANGSALIEGAARLGVPVEVIEGAREAELSWQAVARDFASPGRALAIVDIGGGSTEFVVGEGERPTWRHSYDVGSVRLTERHLNGDPPTAEEIASLERALAEALQDVPRLDPAGRVVGLAGTFTSIAAVRLSLETYDPSRVHGLELSVDELEAIGARLAGLPLSERTQVVGLEPKRADVIVAGVHLAAASVRALGHHRVTIGDRGLRWGYLYARFGDALVG